jgi:2-polyprenyl-6-methoxyphenol hydroxylase-like FAD-dependent oxidoreductase
MTNFTGLRILIVGGGLAGLSLAIALRQRGLIPDIIEHSLEFSTDGKGLFIVGNGTRALMHLGFSDLPMSQGDTSPEGQMYVIRQQAFLNYRGVKLAEIDLETFWAGCGPCLGIRRSTLHDLLLKQATGLPIRFELTVQALHQKKDQVSVQFSDGSKEIYDLIVGADGIYSTIRQLEFGKSNPEFLGQVAWRFIAPLPAGVDRWSVFLGPRRTFLILPIGSNEAYCYADETITSPPIFFSSNEPILRLRKLFRDFASPVSEILAQLESYSQIHYSAIQEVARPHWGRGRVVLIGDAAHAMSPNMASGAAMAFEDALVLADIICQVGDPSEIVPQFILRRSARVGWVQEQTHRRDRIRNLPPVARDLFLKFLVRKTYQTNYQPLLEPM